MNEPCPSAPSSPGSSRLRTRREGANCLARIALALFASTAGCGGTAPLTASEIQAKSGRTFSEPRVTETATGVPGIVSISIDEGDAKQSAISSPVHFLLAEDIAFYPEQAAQALTKVGFEPKSDTEAVAGAALLLGATWPNNKVIQADARRTSSGYEVSLSAKVWSTPPKPATQPETRKFLITVALGDYRFQELP